MASPGEAQERHTHMRVMQYALLLDTSYETDGMVHVTRMRERQYDRQRHRRANEKQLKSFSSTPVQCTVTHSVRIFEEEIALHSAESWSCNIHKAAESSETYKMPVSKFRT